MIRLWLVIQLCLLLTAALERLLPARPSGESLRRARLLWALAWVVPPALAAIGPGWTPDVSFQRLVPAQLYTEAGRVPDFAQAVTAVAPALVNGPVPGVVLLGVVPLVGVLLLARTLVSVQRLRRSAVAFRRIGAVRLAVSPAVSGPTALRADGCWVILDPATVSDPDVDLAIRHELQHHRQGDTAFVWLAALLDVVAWCGPGSWAWRRRLGLLEELAVDAVLTTSRPPVAYAGLLLRVADRCAPAGALALTRSPLHQRLLMLFRPAALTSPFLAAASLVGAVAATVGAALLTAPAVAREVANPDAIAARLNAATPDDGFAVVVDDGVRAALSAMSNDHAAFVRRGVANRPQWAALVDGALVQAGLPPELAAVPLIESGYTNWGADEGASTGAGVSSLAPGIPGRGLWMFIAPTARSYGLRVDATRDERFDPVLETDAAVALLGDLYAEFGDWYLALAGYNEGSRAVRSAIQAGGTRDQRALAARGLLNGYVDQVLAGALVLGE